MALTEKDVLYVADLAHLELTEEEIKKFLPQLDSILQYMEKLNELDTSQVEPMAQVTYPASQRPSLRADAPRKTFAQAAWQIVVADVSMSLDNVLAVAGAAREHLIALVFGLALSVVLMGVAASLIARLLDRQRWIAYVGLAIIFYVACDMIWRGGHEVWPHLL